MPTVKELAERAFEASEYVRALNMMNTPEDYDKRKEAFVALAIAQESEAKAHGMLEGAIKAAQLLSLADVRDDRKTEPVTSGNLVWMGGEWVRKTPKPSEETE